MRDGGGRPPPAPFRLGSLGGGASSAGGETRLGSSPRRRCVVGRGPQEPRLGSSLRRCVVGRGHGTRLGSSPVPSSAAGDGLPARKPPEPVMIPLQVHLQRPCYDFYFL